MSSFGKTHDELAKENSRAFMKDVHKARKKNGQEAKKSNKISRHPLPMGHGFDLRSGPLLHCLY